MDSVNIDCSLNGVAPSHPASGYNHAERHSQRHGEGPAMDTGWRSSFLDTISMYHNSHEGYSRIVLKLLQYGLQ